VLVGVPTTFLILTDHDRAGYKIAEHFEREVRRMVALICKQRTRRRQPPELTFTCIGLNAEQVDQYDVMTRDPKRPRNRTGAITSRSARRAAFGADPGVREGIEGQLDMDILAATRQREAADIAALTEES
jgi:hypothetical protein